MNFMIIGHYLEVFMETNLRGLCWLFLGIVYRSSTPNFRQKVCVWNRNLSVLDEDFENMVSGRSADPQFPIDLLILRIFTK